MPAIAVPGTSGDVFTFALCHEIFYGEEQRRCEFRCKNTQQSVIAADCNYMGCGIRLPVGGNAAHGTVNIYGGEEYSRLRGAASADSGAAAQSKERYI